MDRWGQTRPRIVQPRLRTLDESYLNRACRRVEALLPILQTFFFEWRICSD